MKEDDLEKIWESIYNIYDELNELREKILKIKPR